MHFSKVYLSVLLGCIGATFASPVIDEKKFVLAPVEENSAIPKNAIEVEVQPFSENDLPDDHVLRKKIVAVPVSEIGSNVKVLHNSNGEAALAAPLDNSDEDLVTAENVVFRPLFAYRKKQESRRRINTSAERRQSQDCCRQSSYPQNTYRRVDRVTYIPARQYTYPVYYPTYYRNPEFPTLA